MTLPQLEKISLPLLLSLLLHLILLGVLSYLITSLPKYQPLYRGQLKPLVIKEIRQKDITKIKTVGKETGKKEFSLPPKKTIETRPKDIKLSDLQAPQKSSNEKSEKVIDFKVNKQAPGTKNKAQWTITSSEKNQKTKNKLQEAYPLPPEQAEILDMLGFGFQFDPPEGVSEDELNTLEKIYYSFFKRVYETYVRSFLITFNELSVSRPHLKNELKSSSHALRGRVIFDRKGNIVTISILESTNNDDIHTLFENTLKNMRSVPNPPQDLVKDREEFNIYYQLKIN